MNIYEIIKDFCINNDIELIVNTFNGLNVDADTATAYRDGLCDKIHLNVIQSGELGFSTVGKFTRKINYEIRFLKNCKKSDDGLEYWNNQEGLYAVAESVYRVLLKNYEQTDMTSMITETSVDELDENNNCLKCNVTITEYLDRCL